MGKKIFDILVVKLRNMLIGIFNMLMYFFAFAMPISSWSLFGSYNSTIDNFAALATGLFFLSFGLNSLIQNLTFDKKFIPIFEQHKEMLTDMFQLPPDWLIKMSIMKGLYYSTAILLMLQKRESYAPIVNYLANLEEFKLSIKWYNHLAAWFLFVNLIVFSIGLALGVVVKLIQ